MSNSSFPSTYNPNTHLVPNFTRGSDWRSKPPLVIERGKGCYVWDRDGNKYLDGLAGLFCTNIGHGRTDLAEVAVEQMSRLAFFPTWGATTPPTLDAASLIAERAPGDLDEVFFVNSGSEAVESALKFARNYHLSRGDDQRYKVISREWSYHGTTLGALAVTGIPKFRDPFTPMLWDGVRHVANTCDDPLTPGSRANDLSCVRSVEDMILAEGPETVSMVIAEPVQNGRGALVPPSGYWAELRRICDKYGVLLCADEVICSFGRLGHWFGSELYDVVPDLITFAKGITSAYQPLGGLIARTELVESIWDSPMGMFMHGSTYSGHPVATSVAAANIRALDAEGVLDNVLANQDYFASELNRMAASHNCVEEVRGTGYFYAVEFTKDNTRQIPLSENESAQILGGLLAGFIHDAKIMIRPDGRGATMAMIAPPLIADRTVIDELVAGIDEVVSRTELWLGSSPAEAQAA